MVLNREEKCGTIRKQHTRAERALRWAVGELYNHKDDEREVVKEERRRRAMDICLRM